MNDIPLGKQSQYSATYNPKLLVTVPRQAIRETLQIPREGMQGTDIWNIWEASWLDSMGKPQVACLEVSYDANTEAIIESKSMKLYFNSLNFSHFNNQEDFIRCIQQDLSTALSSDVAIKLITDFNDGVWQERYQCIDDLVIETSQYEPRPELLRAATDNSSDFVEEALCSHLFKTNCMITGQPDWGSVFIRYRGAKIAHSQLLHYLISYRNHQAFHEPSCEMLYRDIMALCKPERLSVYCRYTRRGGIDINPFRSNVSERPLNLRTLRQ